MSKSLKFFLASFALSMALGWGINAFQKSFDAYLNAQISKPLNEVMSFSKNRQQKKPELSLNSKAAISASIDSAGKKKFLYQNNIKEPLPIASITKLMTASVIFSDPVNFNSLKFFTISKAAADQGNTPYYGNLKAEETYTFDKLLELMLIYSSNDAAYAIAETMGIENFVNRMNEKVKEIELANTYFFNSTGLDPKNGLTDESKNLNFSTAEDLTILAEYILNNYPAIFELTAQGLPNINLERDQKLIGGKTGFTKNAGGSIVFIFQDSDGKKIVNVILSAENEETRIEEMQ